MMSDHSNIQLKASSILDVPLHIFDNYFTFIVNGQEFQTSRHVSDLISPNICRIHSTDPTSNLFIINTNHQGDFSRILQLTEFDEIPFLIEVINQLGNKNIEMSKICEITIDNVVSQIKKHALMGELLLKQVEFEIEFISTHFYEIVDKYEDELLSLDDTILSLIVSNPKLCLKNEDQLLNFINQLYNKDPEFSNLYDNIIFENISSKTMDDFLQIFDYNDINGNIWMSLSKRLSNKEKSSIYINRYKKNPNESKPKSFLYDNKLEFNGFFKYLTTKTGGNIHINGIIEITSNSINPLYHPKNLLNQTSFYIIKDSIKDAWVCFDFKKMKIEISNYSLKSFFSSQDKSHIKSWVLEVSNDGENWDKIDEQTNYQGLNGANITKTFEVSKKTFSRYCRIRLTDEYYGYPSCRLALNAIEFYGQIIEE